MVAGLHRSFWGINGTDTTLRLMYPWPRSDVHMKWENVSDVDVETRRFGIRGKYDFRLRVESGTSVYTSLWIAKAKEVQAAKKVIEDHLEKRLNPSIQQRANDDESF